MKTANIIEKATGFIKEHKRGIAKYALTVVACGLSYYVGTREAYHNLLGDKWYQRYKEGDIEFLDFNKNKISLEEWCQFVLDNTVKENANE